VKDWVRRDVRKKEKQRAACVTSFSFFFSVFLFKKENIYIYMGGPARADARASRAAYSPLVTSKKKTIKFYWKFLLCKVYIK
jgi:hypothetical protein